MDGTPVTYQEFEQLLRTSRDKDRTPMAERVAAAEDYEAERKSALRRVNGFIRAFTEKHPGANPLILAVRTPGRPDARLHLNDLRMVIHEQVRRADF